ncbi:hypothetical protein EVAR_28842_1 [Eumeta japonica]|uniref:Uncharacterized protein n=1 Tax=Eumeta variegata TaxID=151549 RepID=A0A4C1WIF7_EUMVA|nr:hypothetical protein EVAR_28842_1 [Eumeta japonica]
MQSMRSICGVPLKITVIENVVGRRSQQPHLRAAAPPDLDKHRLNGCTGFEMFGGRSWADYARLVDSAGFGRQMSRALTETCNKNKLRRRENRGAGGPRQLGSVKNSSEFISVHWGKLNNGTGERKVAPRQGQRRRRRCLKIREVYETR